MCAEPRARSGAALIEALAAMTIFAVAVVALVSLVGQSLRSLSSARDAEARARLLDNDMTAVALWTRPELDAALGTSRFRTWLLSVDRPTSTIYVITLSDTAKKSAALQTALYRAEE